MSVRNDLIVGQHCWVLREPNEYCREVWEDDLPSLPWSTFVFRKC
jgi:hypothetical protein